MKIDVDLNRIIAPSFYPVMADVLHHQHTHYWLKGGRGSTKSSFISIALPMLLFCNPDCHAVVLRKVGATLRNSVYAQVQWGIEQMGLSHKFRFKVSPLEIELVSTHQKILFFGVDDKAKIKSIKLPCGYVGLVWYEELDQFSGMEEIRSLNQSLLRGGAKYWSFYSFNPPKSRDSWVNIEQLYADSDRLLSHSTYLDVPRDWLGEQFFVEAEKLKETRPEIYKHEYLGEVTGTGGAVFDNIEDRRLTDGEIACFDYVKHGIDFGFAVDPLAFVSACYDRKHNQLIIFDELYQTRLTNREAYSLIAPRAQQRLITADSAEPKSIAEMRSYGLQMQAAKKGPDSVAYGIKWLASLDKIIIDKQRCPNTYREFVCYEYDKNRDGQFISSYPDRNNHAIDAVRYMLEQDMRAGKMMGFKINY